MTLRAFFRKLNQPAPPPVVDLHGFPKNRVSPAYWLGLPDVIAGGTLTLAATFAASAGGPAIMATAAANGISSMAIGSAMGVYLTGRAMQVISRRSTEKLDALGIDLTGQQGRPIPSVAVRQQTERLRTYMRTLTLGASGLALLISGESLARLAIEISFAGSPSPMSLLPLVIPAALITRFASGWMRANRLLDGRYRYVAPRVS